MNLPFFRILIRYLVDVTTCVVEFGKTDKVTSSYFNKLTADAPGEKAQSVILSSLVSILPKAGISFDTCAEDVRIRKFKKKTRDRKFFIE